MKRADLDIYDQRTRARLRTDYVSRKLQGSDSGVAAHEAYHRALDRGLEPASRHDLEIDARCREACACRDDQMRDPCSIFSLEQIVDSLLRQPGCGLSEHFHARGGAGKSAASEDCGRIKRRAIRIIARREAGV